ncbi:GyrI-like domain-containing protein [Desulforhopalus sp. 52FAK]
MSKIDYKKELKHLYKPSPKTVATVDVPEMNFLMIDGKGDPNTSVAFQDAIQCLYPVSYTLKFMVKRGEIGIDYGVLPLEGLWWCDDMRDFSVDDKSDWKWKLMIMQPELITQDMVEVAISEVKKKKNPVALPLLKFQKYAEGNSAQMMHIGPFSEEGPTIEKVHNYIQELGSSRTGKHHEIYLSDIRRAKPEKWKTIIRQPMK